MSVDAGATPGLRSRVWWLPQVNLKSWRLFWKVEMA
jgi:hypothetical protein